MPETSSKARVALLIDADNAQLKLTEQVLEIAARYGQLKICRAYGDWKKPNLSGSLEKLAALDIDCVQVDRVGKNATDHRLLIDVVQILHTYLDENAVRTFVIASGDGDFASVCKYLQERGKQVIGIGNEAQTSESLRQTYNNFFPLGDPKPVPAKPAKPQSVLAVDASADAKSFDLLLKAFMQVREPDGRAHLSKIVPAFKSIPNYKNRFGGKKPTTLLKAYPKKFKIKGDYVSLVE